MNFIPVPDPIPVQWWWFQAFLLLLFPIHLLAMNAMVGGLGLSIFEWFRGGPANRRVAHTVAVSLPVVVAFAVNMGVAPLLFLQVLYGHLIYTSTILMGAFWILVIPMLIAAYYGLYLYDFRFKQLGGLGVIIAIGALALLVVIGYMFSNNMTFMTLPHLFSEYFDHMGGDMLVSWHAMFLPRFLHMMAGSVAIGGLFVAVLGELKRKVDPEVADQAKSVGMKTFFWVTLLNIAIGTWFLLRIPGDSKMIFLGAKIWPTLLFGVAILLVISALLASRRQRLWPTVVLSVLVIYVMTFMRAYLRGELLQGYFYPSTLKVTCQYSPLVFFLAVLLFGMGCIVWMVRITRKARVKA